MKKNGFFLENLENPERCANLGRRERALRKERA